MSDLKHLTRAGLLQARKDTLKLIKHHERCAQGLTGRKLSYRKSHIAGQKERLKWIESYLCSVLQ